MRGRLSKNEAVSEAKSLVASKKKSDVALALRYTELDALPSIGRLTWLVEINLCDNRLQTLPASVGKLQRLERLYVRRNRLRELPDVICTLKRLHVLDVDGNQLTTLPDKLGDISALQVLYASNNPLASLPSSLERLRRLEVVELRHTMLHNSGRSLDRLVALVHRCGVQSLVVGDESNGALHQSLRIDEAVVDDDDGHARDMLELAISNRVAKTVTLHVLGFGFVGKTATLAALEREPQLWRTQRLLQRAREDKTVKAASNKRTKGMVERRVVEWDMEVVWRDYPGQLVFHHTHRLFCTSNKRDAIVIVLNPTEKKGGGRVERMDGCVEVAARVLASFRADGARSGQ